jgi:hypothetical protein
MGINQVFWRTYKEVYLESRMRGNNLRHRSSRYVHRVYQNRKDPPLLIVARFIITYQERHPSLLEKLRRQTGIPSDWAATSNASWVFPWRSDYKWLTHTVALKV